MGKLPRKISVLAAAKTTVKFRGEYDTGEKGRRGEEEINSRSKQTPGKLLSSAASEMHLQFYEPGLDHNHGLGSKRKLLESLVSKGT